MGYDDGSPVNKFLYKRQWKFDPSIPMHMSMCRLAEELGYPAACVSPRLRYTYTPSLELPDSYVLFHLCAADSSRTWSIERWHTFLKKARAQWPELPFVFSGSGKDRHFVEAVAQGISRCESYAGRTPQASQLIELIDKATFFVGVDTGNTQIAAFREKLMVVVGTRRTSFWQTDYNPHAVWLAATAHCKCDSRGSWACATPNEDGVSRLRCVTDTTDEEVLVEIKKGLLKEGVYGTYDRK